MPGPLSNYRIIDLTTIISGPYATQLLGDQGADVIKVEPLAGDLMRRLGPMRGGISSQFLLNNRNKRSVALDLKHDDGKAVLRRLIESADVFVQNFRPGAIERMGFSEKQVRSLKSDIVFVSISGFGESGPYSHKRVYDPIIQALSGVMARQGLDQAPRVMRTLLADKVTALTAAQAITAALLGCERTGQGEHVQLSMIDSTIAWLWPDVLVNDTLIGDGVSPPIKPGAYYKAFNTSDGYIMIMVVSDDEWQGFVRATGRLELFEDARFQTVPNRIKHNIELYELIRVSVQEGSTAEWVARLDAEQVPCAHVNSLQELFTDSQVEHNELILETEHPQAGPMRSPRPAARFTEQVVGEQRPAPALGQHTDELLTEIEIPEIDLLRKQGVIL
ncbi:MAG: CoA transferase [Gammaproteobacteria bacterium]|jgi:crotonobetainyl-CoA:carnitine CoA-transferase CaiB-like acyl-CoA transferase|nr:CoA transferase [Gammaproteobacteria bacterium]MDP7455689.1 CoA transferase [Gammaproteobacteria bacterium]HJO12546.1 CoA transferase [Gammaproteobacteria bacterium]